MFPVFRSASAAVKWTDSVFVRSSADAKQQTADELQIDAAWVRAHRTEAPHPHTDTL